MVNLKLIGSNVHSRNVETSTQYQVIVSKKSSKSLTNLTLVHFGFFILAHAKLFMLKFINDLLTYVNVQDLRLLYTDTGKYLLSFHKKNFDF